MKVFLTGASGYIGGHLKRHLEASGCEVASFGRGISTVEMVEVFKGNRPDVVIHLASLFIAEHKTADIASLIASNLLFGTQLAEAMQLVGIKSLVVAGTSWQHFGRNHDEPVCLYAATKTAYEQILKYFVSAHAFQVVALKIFDTYGPEDTRPKLLPKLLACFESQQSLELSPGEQQIDLVHINDIVLAFESAARGLLQGDRSEGFFRSYALSSGEPVTLRTLVRMLENLKGRSLNVRWGARPYRAREVMQPWSGGERLPGWKPQTHLESGLRSLVGAI